MSEHPDACEIIVTAPDSEWLRHFTDALVSDRLCAAVHRFQAVDSTYWWRDQIHHRPEYRASLHTRRSLSDAVVSRARREHPYEVPGVAVLPIVGGDPAYLAWIVAETAPPVGP